MWRPIEDYSSYYFINEHGQIRSRDRFVRTKEGRYVFKRGKYLKPRINNCGYMEVRLSLLGKKSTCFIHRLLADAFLDKVEGKPEINHKNGIKVDNRLENLERVTRSENMRHAYQHNLVKCASIQVVDICTGQVFDSIKEAASMNGLAYSTLKNYLSGKRKNPTCLRILD